MSAYVPVNQEEKEFLESYDPKQFTPISVTVDAVIFGVSKLANENYRKLDKQSLKILLVKREEYPFKDCYALPGGFVLENETLTDSLNRTLFKKTGLKDVYSEQLYTFGDVDRDPRMRIISCAYISLLDTQKAKIKDAEWVDINEIDDLNMAFDHRLIINEAL